MRRKNSLFLRPAALFLVASCLIASRGFAQQPDGTSSADVVTLSTPSGRVVGSSRLVRSDTGISFTLHTSELVPGNAYTVWWIIDDNEGGITMHATGGIAGCLGQASFAARLLVGRIPSTDGKTVLGGGGLLFDTPRQATVTLVVRDHGPAIQTPPPGLIDDQITTFAGGCNVNRCADVQMTTHRRQP